jgi:hypothetical protein
MGADEYDYRRDDYIEELRAEFELDQLQSYYLDNRFDLLAPARGSFDRARALYPVDATASFVFSICATDLILRGILLRPLLSGIVHDRVAAAIADELMNHSRTADPAARVPSYMRLKNSRAHVTPLCIEELP